MVFDLVGTTHLCGVGPSGTLRLAGRGFVHHFGCLRRRAVGRKGGLGSVALRRVSTV